MRTTKGSQFERHICRQLSVWWSGRDDVFWRTAGSGGRATGRFQRGMTTAGGYGDVSAVDPIGFPLLRVFTFELKRGYGASTNLQDIIDHDEGNKPKKGGWRAWIDQARRSAEQAGSYTWAVISKRNRRTILIIMPETFAIKRLHLPASAVICLPQETIAVVQFSDFLKVDPRTVADISDGLHHPHGIPKR